MKIKKGDLVQVIAGDDRPQGKEERKKPSGKVLKVFPKDDKVIVEGVKYIFRHVRPSRKNPRGGRVEKESVIHISNIMIFCEKCEAAVRIATKLDDKKNRIRVCKKCGTVIGNRV